MTLLNVFQMYIKNECEVIVANSFMKNLIALARYYDKIYNHGNLEFGEMIERMLSV